MFSCFILYKRFTIVLIIDILTTRLLYEQIFPRKKEKLCIIYPYPLLLCSILSKRIKRISESDCVKILLILFFDMRYL